MPRPAFLVLEDNSDLRDDICRILLDAGCTCLQAADPVEAVRCAGEERFHACVVDLKMPGDLDVGPLGGQRFLAKLAEILAGRFWPQVIVVTHFETRERLREAFRDYRVVDFIDRERPDWRERLSSAIQQAVQRIGINFAQQVFAEGGLTWQTLTDLTASNQLVVEPRSASEDDIRDVLAGLFPGNESVYLRPLAAGRSGAQIVKAFPVTTVHGQRMEVGRVVKIGSHDDIQEEVSRYQLFVKPFIGGSPGRTTVVEDRPVYTCLLAGVKYSLIEGSLGQINTFARYYIHSRQTQVKQALENLFTDTCKRWFTVQVPRVCDLAEWYIGPRRLKAIEESFRQFFPNHADALLVEVDGLDQAVPNPLAVLKKRVSRSAEYIFSIVHGDMHAENILVDETDGRTWLIDFAKIPEDGLGHRLEDLTRLEIAILFEILESNDVRAFVALARAIREIRNLTIEATVPGEIAGREQFLKAFHAVMSIHGIAGNIQYPQVDASEYMVALYCQAWLSMRYLGRSIDPEKKMCLLAFLSVLSDALN